jgi:5-methylcytosine-specific restriction protein A
MIQRRTPLRSRSNKRARLYRDERVPLVRAMLDARPVCERCHAAPSTDVHEVKSRARGGSITDPDNLAALCRPCHTWITTHPADATAQGWLRASWD